MLREKQRRKADNDLLAFTRYTSVGFDATDFHKTYYRILDMFAKGKLFKVMVSIPAQHGKSEGSTRKLPAFMFGLNPNQKIGIGCYNDDMAKSFNRDIKRIVKDQKYSSVFPKTFLPKYSDDKEGVEQANYFDVGDRGFLKTVGRGGALTGTPIDVMIMDDLYKDKFEAYSPIYRKRVIDWYTSVVRTRYHNDTRELMVFTRWHEEDLMGWIETKENVVKAETWDDVISCPKDAWLHINLPALKVGPKTEIDPRESNDPLWKERHSYNKLIGQRNLNSIEFECMMQGNPASSEGLLYGQEDFRTYKNDGEQALFTTYYCDTADKGEDYLCCIIFDWMQDKTARIREVIYTQEDQDVTIPLVSSTIRQYGCKFGVVEANSGGQGFIRSLIADMSKYDFAHTAFPHHQTENKEGRILSNAMNVKQRIFFPVDYRTRFYEFSLHLHKYKRLFSANTHDDAADTLTGVYEMVDDVIKLK